MTDIRDMTDEEISKFLNEKKVAEKNKVDSLTPVKVKNVDRDSEKSSLFLKIPETFVDLVEHIPKLEPGKAMMVTNKSHSDMIKGFLLLNQKKEVN